MASKLYNKNNRYPLGLDKLNPIVKQLVDNRRTNSIPITDLSDQVGRCVSAMQKLENGQRLPTFPVLMAWADTLGYEVVLKKKSETGD